VAETRSSVPGLRADPPICIGRERELAQVWEQLGIALRSHVRSVAVTGDPGIGKTRLLTEVAARASHAGVKVLYGGASEAAGMPPYLPFLEALGHYIRTAPTEALHEQVGADATILTSLFPELGVRLETLPTTYTLPADQARLRLYQAVSAFLATIAADDGLVLVFDDLQWADSSSLDLIAHVARQQPTARLLFLIACRAGDIALDPALERALAELNHLRVLATLALAPLAEEKIAALAAVYLGGPIEPATSRLLHTHSEGNPFFAEELLRAWVEDGALVPPGSARTCWTLTLPLRETLPASIASAIRLRLIRLAPEVVDQLRVASVIGGAFDVDLLAQVQNAIPGALEEHLLAAERAGLVHGNQAGRYTFSHEKVRECLYSEVSSTRRQMLHGQIGLALEANGSAKDTRRLADLAFHFSNSRDSERGVHYLQRAAEEALRIYAPQQALAHLQTALTLLKRDDPQCGDPRRGALLLALGEAALMAADESAAEEAFIEAQTCFVHQGDCVSAARAQYGCGIAHWRLDEAEAARRTLETALALLDTAPHPEPAAVQVLVALANLLGVVLGHQDEAIRYGRQALEIAQQLGDKFLQASAGRTIGFLLVRDNDLAAGIPLLEQALAQAQQGDDPVEAAACCAYLAQAYSWSAALERSREVSLLRETYARVCPQPHQQSYVYTWLAFLDTLHGAWTEAESDLALAQPAVEYVASLEPRAFFQQVRGFLAFQQGDYRQAERELRAGIEVFRTQDPGELLLCLGLFGLALLATGKYREARVCMDEQERLITTLAAGSLSALSARGCVALMAVGMNDAKRAASHYTDLLACRGQHHWFLVDRILGEIATLTGAWSDAAAHLDTALRITERERLLPEKGRILIAQANLELAQGRPSNVTRARQRLTEAMVLFRDLRCKSLVRQIRQRLRELPREPSTRSNTPIPAALSPREVEVLRLVATGKHNREIAQALNISESTVAKHLTAIFDKTGCENRAAVTAFAFRHGLT